MFPIRDTIPSQRVPVATWLIILANVVVFVFQLMMPHGRLHEFTYLFGIVPYRYTHPGWARSVGFPPHDFWPFLTSMFLHGGWLHIISNMWTLWIFGDNVEERMGSFRFLFFYLLSGLAAAIVHVVTNGNSQLPVVGASGAIAGVLAAYLVLFPLARVVCMIPIFFYPLFVEVHAFVFILIWFVSQFFNGALSLMGPGQIGGIAWWAHIGGFGAGLVLYRRFLIKEPGPPRPASVE